MFGIIEGLNLGLLMVIVKSGEAKDYQETHDAYSELSGYCAPDDVTTKQLEDIFVGYMAANPAERHLPASSLFLFSMRSAFPCSHNQ